MHSDQLILCIWNARKSIPPYKPLNTILWQGNVRCDVKLPVAEKAYILNAAWELNAADSLYPVQVALRAEIRPSRQYKSENSNYQGDLFCRAHGMMPNEKS
jgi:hypothetical protein